MPFTKEKDSQMPGLEVRSIINVLCLIWSSEVESKLDLFCAIKLNYYVQIAKSNFVAENKELSQGQSSGSWKQRQDLPHHMCCDSLGNELCSAHIWCMVFSSA